MIITDITGEDIIKRFPKRPEDSHKGTFGKVMIVAGSRRYRGAAALAAEGALRMGAGIVTVASTETVFPSIQARIPEAIYLPLRENREGVISAENAYTILEELANGYTALLVGCGGVMCEETGKLTQLLIAGVEAAFSGIGFVLDADSLNSCAEEGLPVFKNRCVITPHPGEMARLCHTDIPKVKKNKERLTADYASVHNCTVVFKEHHTLIASPSGKMYRNNTGNSGLARGGSGDILAGMTAALLAQKMEPDDAAICAVWLHGAAADEHAALAVASKTTMLPHDIFGSLSKICSTFE